MNPFWAQLEKAIKNLSHDPDPSCLGLYVCEHNLLSDTLSTEMVGAVPQSTRDSCRFFATKKVISTLCRGEMRSLSLGIPGGFCLWPVALPTETKKETWKQDILEMCPGAITLGLNAVGVDGHDPMVNEAIALLYLAAIGQKNNPLPFEHVKFYVNLRLKVLNFSKKFIPNNPWIEEVAFAMGK